MADDPELAVPPVALREPLEGGERGVEALPAISERADEEQDLPVLGDPERRPRLRPRFRGRRPEPRGVDAVVDGAHPRGGYTEPIDHVARGAPRVGDHRPGGAQSRAAPRARKRRCATAVFSRRSGEPHHHRPIGRVHVVDPVRVAEQAVAAVHDHPTAAASDRGGMEPAEPIEQRDRRGAACPNGRGTRWKTSPGCVEQPRLDPVRDDVQLVTGRRAGGRRARGSRGPCRRSRRGRRRRSGTASAPSESSGPRGARSGDGRERPALRRSGSGRAASSAPVSSQNSSPAWETKTG